MRALVVAAVLFLPLPALAADVETIGRKLVVLDGSSGGAAKTVFVGIGSGAPLEPPGSGVAVEMIVRSGAARAVFTLPAGADDGTSGWRISRRGRATYKNRRAPAGPTGTKSASLTPQGAVELTALNAGDAPLGLASVDLAVDGVAVAFVVEGAGEPTRYCTRFPAGACTLGTNRSGAPVKLTCARGVPDPTCRATLPPSTTSTSSSTTSSTSTTSTSTTLCLDERRDTVVDVCRGLEWERKTEPDGWPTLDGLNDGDDWRPWQGACEHGGAPCQEDAASASLCAAESGGAECRVCTPAEGACEVLGQLTTVWRWLSDMRTSEFAGHDDWRLPTSAGCCGTPTGDAGELEALIDATRGACGGGSGGCIVAGFSTSAMGGRFYSGSSPIGLADWVTIVDFEAPTPRVSRVQKYLTGLQVMAVRDLP